LNKPLAQYCTKQEYFLLERLFFATHTWGDPAFSSFPESGNVNESSMILFLQAYL